MKHVVYLLVFMLIAITALTAQTPVPSGNSKEAASPDVTLLDDHIPPSTVPGITSGFTVKVPLKVAGQAERYTAPTMIKRIADDDSVIIDMGWKLIDSYKINTLLPASSNLGVKLNTETKKLEPFLPYTLTDNAVLAVAKAPSWIRPVLQYTFGKLTSGKQDTYANVILNAQAPYVDEVCYAIANSSPQFLGSKLSYPQLFLENAVTMYKNDSSLNYVEIIDYGTPGVDEDYYSTVKYRRKDTLGNIQEVEVPRDVYYLYIVHPKITDEIPSYIDPLSAEYNTGIEDPPHTLNIKAPPLGRFWREFMFNYTESKNDGTGAYYPILKDSIARCDVLWDESNTSSPNAALRVITNWINEVMDFTSKVERPHQPLRIYSLHIGRCGEHEDITAAAARSCLIPCRGIEAMSSDHVWNEFWDQDWQQWEPVNNSFYNKYTYSVGWKKKFGSVICHQSNGVCIPVTDTYCHQTAKIKIYAVDSTDKPIDGALVILYVSGVLSADTYFDSYSISDINGKSEFVVDSGHTYFAYVNSSNIKSQTYKLVDNAAPGETYSFKIPVPTKMPEVSYSELPKDTDTSKLFRIVTDYKTDNHYIYWYVAIDDYQGAYVLNEAPGSLVNFFITDQENYESCAGKKQYQAWNPIVGSEAGTVEYFLPQSQSRYFYFNNGNRIKDLPLVDATVKLYEWGLVGVEDETTINSSLVCAPNPAVNTVNIMFDLPAEERVQLDIYNSSGILVSTLVNTVLDPGRHCFTWNTNDLNNQSVPSGVYFYTLRTATGAATGKVSVMR